MMSASRWSTSVPVMISPLIMAVALRTLGSLLPNSVTSGGMLRLLDGVGFESAVCAIAPEGAITNEEPQASASITFPNFLLKPFEAYFNGFIVANFSNISGLCHGLAEPRLSGGSPWRMRHIASGKHDPERSEAHTSELQSLMRLSYAILCLKKKKQK